MFQYGAMAIRGESAGGNTPREITRREALRKGSLAGLGMMWVTPAVTTIEMSAQFAQATSPVPETTAPPEVESETVVNETPETTGAAPQDEVIAEDLPFTGLPLEQLLPLAGGAIATGAAAVRLAREKEESGHQDPS